MTGYLTDSAPRPGRADGGAIRPPLPLDMVADVRSDHAGETGAVFIYRGILAVTRNAEVQAFARDHLGTEQRHLRLMEELLPGPQRSRLLPIWRLAGWMTGALPAIFGPTAVYRTIDAVETFVDQHYAEQVSELDGRADQAALRELLESCRLDEVGHRDEARRMAGQRTSVFGKLWVGLVAGGSRLGVSLAQRF